MLGDKLEKFLNRKPISRDYRELHIPLATQPTIETDTLSDAIDSISDKLKQLEDSLLDFSNLVKAVSKISTETATVSSDTTAKLNDIASKLDSVIDKIKNQPEVKVDRELTKYLKEISVIKESLKRQEYQGRIDPRTLEASDTDKHIDLIKEYPNTPWLTAYFFNDGPDSVYIAINRADEFKELEFGDDYTIDFSRGDKKIELIYYKCDSGETASVDVIGKF